MYCAPEMQAFECEMPGVVCGSESGSIVNMTVLDAIDGDSNYD